jgi:IclR family KDG regulon transcriptional repressor
MGRSVPALTRAFDILELFAGVEELSVPEIVDRLGLPRTSVHELVGTMVERAYLAPVPGQSHRYRLGMAVHHLGALYAERLDLARDGQAVAADVVAQCRETVHVAVLDGAEVVYVAKVDSTHPIRMVSAVGRRLPAHCTAVGLMLLASLDDAKLDVLLPYEQRLPAMTRRSITSPKALRKRLAEVRERGLAFEYCESNEAVACVAAGVHDRTGATVAAMSISVPTLRWNDQRAEELGRLITKATERLSARLGHQSL